MQIHPVCIPTCPPSCATDQQAHLQGILAANGLKLTPTRQALIAIFTAASRPLSQAEILSALGALTQKADRVSIYRNLIQFQNLGLIHEISPNRYVLCQHQDSAANSPHLLLYCEKCTRHEERRPAQISEIFLKHLSQLDFFGTESSFKILGTCAKCRE